MKRFSLILLTFVALSFGSAEAQITYTIDADTAYFNLQSPGGYEEAKIKLSNNTTSDIEVEWTVESVSLPDNATWVSQGACDWNKCISFPDPFVVFSDTSTLFVNDIDKVFKVGMRRLDGAPTGCSQVVVAFREIGSTAPVQRVAFRHSSGSDFNCWAVSVEDYTKELVSVYPNPTHNVVNLNVLDKNVKVVQLTNIIGKQIQRLDISGSNGGMYQLSLQSLPKGIYVLQFRNSQGKVLGVRRITKQ